MAESTEYSTLARELIERLNLVTPPVALSFVDGPPAGVKAFTGNVPSSCSFWRRAESEVFYAAADQHFNCAVGAMTMGFELPQPIQQDLMGVVQMMCATRYIGADEPASMPTVKGAHKGIVYGPLAEFPVPADLVIMWLTARQAMLFGEAAGQVRWTREKPMSVSGRPACSALPIALSSAAPRLSLGCLGMRTFTEVSDDKMLAVVPARELKAFTADLSSAQGANFAMAAVYDSMKAGIAKQAVAVSGSDSGS